MSEYTVQLDHVTKRFGEVVAVRDMALGIRDGEFFSLLGPSGCGKTTTLRMIAGFEIPNEGRIFIQGREMGLTPPFQRPVNTVFQNYALFPHMTVYENIAFGLEMKKVPRREIRRQVEEALELVRLPGLEQRKPGQLSGGQQQRVALARALINRPAVLLLDEPLGSLDLKLRKAMQLELKHMQHQVGITFVYVTHDQEEALTMSDRIAVMDQGLVLQVGEPVDIYERPANRFVADFIGETNFLGGRVTAIAAGTATVAVDEALEVQATSISGLVVGQRVTLAVRPEKINLHADAADCQGCVAGQVEEVIYIGTDTRYLVRLTDRSAVVVRVQNLGAGVIGRYQPGDHVHLTWSPDSARLLVD